MDREYKRKIWAWTMYDWANSAFATTILAAVLPVYYSQVAAATLSSPAMATAYWSTGLSVALLITAILSPILGTISDVMRGKKRFLAIFVGLGVLATGLLVLIKRGDWLLASLLFVFGRIGFTAANVFYDALLPHVAKKDDLDRVSARGYAFGYLGGGLLLAVNVVMIRLLPGTWGPRLSFLSVALWWALFTIPLLKRIPEPHTLSGRKGSAQNVLAISFKRLVQTLREIKQYKELFKFLLAFLIYIDGIGTIIGVAAIYGAELGFGSMELILALLLVQFVGIPFSLIFGRLPGKGTRYRPLFLAFILFNLILLPTVGIVGSRLLPRSISGGPPAAFESTDRARGQGSYQPLDSYIRYSGNWSTEQVGGNILKAKSDKTYRESSEPGARLDFVFNGQQIALTYAVGPDFGIWTVEIDGRTLEEDGRLLEIDCYSPNLRYESSKTLLAQTAGEHTLSLINGGLKNEQSRGTRLSFAAITVRPPLRTSNLGFIILSILAMELFCFLLALLLGRLLFSRVVELMSTKRSIFLALLVYGVIAIWGFFLDSVIEFWCLAWLVACVQGGSQALSRSLYSSLVPAAKSGEFFGFFGIMEKFASFLGPLVFAAAVIIFGSSRPAVLSLVLFFIVGGVLLSRVDVEAGRRVAQEEDDRLKAALN